MPASSARGFGRRPSSWLIVVLVVLMGGAMLATGFGQSIDRALMPLRYGIVDRTASGRIAIVEMDADSAAAIRRWPWSRSNYASVVDNLRKAGAKSIVFDVDFSSRSDDAGDRAFSQALARADGLVALPTFGQVAGSQDRRTIDALPLPAFRDHAALASVSIRPDPDGQVRNMPLGTITEGTPRPSLAAFIAGRSGAADTEFPIDMSIDPSSIPRFSFIGVRDGRFDPAAVRGRDILIGATAIEMGDRYGTPRWGVIPGVVVQALAAETLFQGIPARGERLTILTMAIAAIAAIVGMRSGPASVILACMSIVMLAAFVLVAQYRFLVTYPMATSITMIVAATVACIVRHVLGRFRSQQRTDEATGLPNARALFDWAKPDVELTLAVVQIDNYEALRAVLGNFATADVVIRLGERTALVADNGTNFRTAENQLSFALTAGQMADDTLQGLRAMLLQPVEVGGRRVDVAATLGIATGDGRDVERLLSDASLAAEAARTAGVFWQRAATDMDGLERSISLMGELDAAIEAGHIEVFYQPKYHLRECRIVSVEALVRWRHPTRGFIGPDLFIPAAEKSNRIAALTLHVIRQVVRDVDDWRRTTPDVTAAINISAILLSDVPYNSAVERILLTAPIPASSLVFEVTESAAMTDPDAAVAALCRYRDLGVAISMDDYGTGQSTLTYLKRLPLAELKIDRSFVQFAHRNAADAVLVRSTIDLAHQLGLKVVAEGVEDDECLRFLTSVGCDLVQGYVISRPVPSAELSAILMADVEKAPSNLMDRSVSGVG
ncbi:putative bifunctional diguanylate cyclase/phosphodiesterase [Sphingomonas sp. RS2018]